MYWPDASGKSVRLLSRAEASAILARLRTQAESAAIAYRKGSNCSRKRMVDYANGCLIGSIMQYERRHGVKLPRK